MTSTTVGSIQSLSPSGWERRLVVLAALVAPLWFLGAGVVNLTVMDLLLLTVAVSIVVRRRRYPLFPDRLMGVGVVGFLVALAGSLLVTPVPLDGLLTFLQYGLVFVVVVPVFFAAFLQERTRWRTLLGLSVVLNVVVAMTAIVSVGLGGDNISLWWGNTNQLYWLVATGFVLNAMLALELWSRRWVRLAYATMAVVAALTTFQSRAASAMLMVAVGVWFIVLYALADRPRGRRLLPAYLGGSVVLVAVGVAFAVTNVTLVTSTFEVSLEPRIIQYSNGLRIGLQNVPFGTGIESAEEVFAREGLQRSKPVHNAFVSILLEAGPIALVGFGIVILYWFRDVFISSISHIDVPGFDRIPVVIFGSQLASVTMFQPSPIRRFWWLFFAMGAAAYVDRRSSSSE